METKSWTTVDKSTWGDGPWRDEPDKVQWTDETTGLPCLVVRSTLTGAWCGYVGVTEGHPWYGASPSDISHSVSVYGGLNFATFCQDDGDESQGICHVPVSGEPDHVYWLGFDCGHAFDLSPAMEARLRRLDPALEEMRKAMFERAFPDEVYRDLGYVQGEVRSLAQQVADEKLTTPSGEN